MRGLLRPRVLFTALVFVCLYAPIVLVVVFSVNKDPQLLHWEGFTLKWYKQAFEDQAVRHNLGVSVQVAILSTAISLVIAITGGLWYRYASGRSRAVFDAMTYSRIVLPEVVFALGLFALFDALDIGLGMGAIVLGHVVFNSAYATIIMQARFATMSSSLEEAAADLGANRWRVFRRVTLPLLMPAVIVAGLLTLTFSLDDVITSQFLGGTQAQTLPVLVLGKLRLHVTPEVNAIGSGLMFMTLVTFAVAGLITMLRPTGAGGVIGLGREGGGVSAAIALRGLRKVYGGVPAVDRVDVEVAEGEFFSLIGPSGCGKTTTLRMIAGLVDPTEGVIEVRGRDVTTLRPHRRPVNTVFQQYALFPHLTIFDNVAFGLQERKTAKPEIARRVEEMLELVDLTGRGGDKPSELSGGQQQRVALARSLVLEPEVLLLDEPLGALDLKLRKQLQLQLKRIQHDLGITFVYVTHDQEEAFSMSDRVAIMRNGLIEQLGTPRDVYQRPVTEFVADFVGVANRRSGRVAAVQDDGRYLVEVPGLAAIPSAGVPGLSAGQAVAVIVRPESVLLGPQGDGWTTISAQVLDVAFLGPHVSCVVETPDGVAMTLTADGHETLAAGDRCEIGWAHSATWVLPLDAQAAAEAAAADPVEV